MMNPREPVASVDRPRRIFWALAFLMLLAMVVQSHGHGMNWDESWFKDYGERVLKFYTSFGQDTSYKDYPLNSTYEHLIHYGALFEVSAAVANEVFSGFDPYDVRHALIAVCGFVAVLFCGLTAKELVGWLGAVLASLFLFATPVFVGNSMHNSKDIPFAAAFIMSLYFMMIFLKDLPKVRWSTAVLVTLAIASAMNIRIGGVMLIAYLGLFSIVRSSYLYLNADRADRSQLARRLGRSLVPLSLIAIGAYFAGQLLWPFGLSNPIVNPFISLKHLSNIDFFDSYSLFEGHWVHRWEIPWYYVPKWMAITTPLFISALPVVAVIAIVRRRFDAELILHATLMLFAAIFPVAYVIARKSNLYDSWRHLFFVYPPLVVVAATVWDRALASMKGLAKGAAVVCLAAFILEPLAFMARNRPLESFYFSPLIGGIRGAFKKYEIDYYGTSLRSAIEWLAASPSVAASAGPVRVKSWYGEHLVARYYLGLQSRMRFVEPPEGSLDWDYSLVLPAQAKYDSKLLLNWPPTGTVHEITVDGVPIVAIVENTKASEDLSAALRATGPDLTSAYFVNLSLQFYQRGDYYSASAAADRASGLDSGSYVAYSNLCAALNALGVFDEGAKACERAIELNSEFQLARNNRAYALSAQNDPGIAKAGVDTFINLSLAFFNVGEFEKSIRFARRALEIQPTNAVAYNNLCAAYNGLGDWDMAIAAGEKAVQMAPDFALAKGNLAFAKAQKGSAR
jgi:Flp pilus assembly protein TadD